MEELRLRIKDVDLRDFFEERLQFGHKFWIFYIIFVSHICQKHAFLYHSLK
jgi:hypothetical protein